MPDLNSDFKKNIANIVNNKNINDSSVVIITKSKQKTLKPKNGNKYLKPNNDSEKLPNIQSGKNESSNI
jgi:hypothetical protein